jgi:hypothetical protein
MFRSITYPFYHRLALSFIKIHSFLSNYILPNRYWISSVWNHNYKFNNYLVMIKICLFFRKFYSYFLIHKSILLIKSNCNFRALLNFIIFCQASGWTTSSTRKKIDYLDIWKKNFHDANYFLNSIFIAI